MVLQRIPFVIGFFADATDFLFDTLKDALAGTVILGFGGIFFGGIGAVLMGIYWTVLVLFSKANIGLRILAAPLFFLMGAFLGVFPWPLPGLTLFLDYGLKNKDTANFVCFVPAILLILAILFLGYILNIFGILSGESACSIINSALVSIG